MPSSGALKECSDPSTEERGSNKIIEAQRTSSCLFFLNCDDVDGHDGIRYRIQRPVKYLGLSG